MSCNTCQVKFTFFTRENGCPMCGFSYCSKCLKYKSVVPDIGMKKVCGKCHHKIENSAGQTVPQTNLPASVGHESTEPATETMLPIDMSEKLKSLENEVIPPIDITRKLSSLENPAKPPIVLYKKEVGRWDRLKSGLDPVDQEMVDRLRKLKNQDKPIPQPSLDEIKRRLALLKDQDPDKPEVKINIHQVDTRTDEEKTADLINEYLEELELSSETNSDSQIEARLARLRGIDPSKMSQQALVTETDDTEDEQTMTKKIIKKAFAEAALESKYEMDELETMDVDNGEKPPIEEELPWCTICNEDAKIRCLGCDGDLYCSSCFRQGHDSFEMTDHRHIPFEPPKKPHEN